MEDACLFCGLPGKALLCIICSQDEEKVKMVTEAAKLATKKMLLNKELRLMEKMMVAVAHATTKRRWG